LIFIKDKYPKPHAFKMVDFNSDIDTFFVKNGLHEQTDNVESLYSRAADNTVIQQTTKSYSVICNGEVDFDSLQDGWAMLVVSVQKQVV
jgi:hypothetical protein